MIDSIVYPIRKVFKGKKNFHFRISNRQPPRLDSALGFELITPDPEEIPQVIHGTFNRFWPAIVSSGGLNIMNRTHIHFTRCLPNDEDKKVISGMKQDCNVFIYINVKRAMTDGYEFFESANGVILCAGDKNGTLSTEFFEKVTPRRLMKDITQNQADTPTSA